MSASAVLTLWSTSVGKKVVMAVTGVVLVGFVIVHMAGNLKIYFGEASFNAYATFLREMGAPLLMHEQALWTMRVILLAAVVLHLWAAVDLTQRSWAARPVGYRRKQDVASTYASRTMRWGGLIVLLFVVYHILHFTVGAVGFAPGQFQPTSVYQNVVAGFRVWYVSAFYVAAMLALGLHLWHGTWSMLQTLGVIDPRWERTVERVSAALAVVTVAGNVSVPLAVLTVLLR
jgi:succinate dehydrogenase / fumarate reductase cytochrome b subunit